MQTSSVNFDVASMVYNEHDEKPFGNKPVKSLSIFQIVCAIVIAILEVNSKQFVLSTNIFV